VPNLKQTIGKAIVVAALVCLGLFQAGCGPSGFRDPITKFQAASSVVIASTRLYLTELNKTERDHYIQGQLSRQLEIKLDAVEASQVFTKESLKARLDALSQLGSYGDLLLKLANSDAPGKVKAEAQSLGDEVKALSSTVSGLTGNDDIAFKAAVGPVAAIVGDILDLVLQEKIKDALEKAIKNGKDPVNNLLTVIHSDINLAYERKRSMLSDLRVALVDQYNKGKSQMLAERIIAHEDRWEAFASADPGEGLDAMAKAHVALVKYAESSHKATDLASLVDAMEAFAARAVSIGRAVQALQRN
jgi:hypothetical protein